MDVHQAEVEILAIKPAVGRFVVILEPVGADDVRAFQQTLERIAKSGGAFLLRVDHRIDSATVFVAAAIFSRGHVELADEHRLAGQGVKCIQIKPRETAIVPTRVEIAGDGVHVARAGAGHFRIIERLITVPQNQGPPIVFADNLVDQGVVTFGQEGEKTSLDLDAVAARAQKERAVPFEFLPVLHAGCGLKIPQQFRPIVGLSQ